MQCSVIIFYFLAKGNDRCEEHNKVNLSAVVSLALYHVSQFEPKSR